MVQVILNVMIVPYFAARFGEGGGGVASALSVIGTELAMTVMLVAAVGRAGYDARSVRVFIKTIFVVGTVVAIDRFTVGYLGPLRIAVDACAYVVLAIATGAVNVRELMGFVLRSRKASHV